MPRDEGLRLELLDLASRPGAIGNADRLWEILDDYECWPGFRLVGIDGEHAAWLVVQLADTELQRRALGHLEVAVDNRDANPAHYACLVDRVRMADGREQVYGSQFVVTDGETVAPWPIADALDVDRRRIRVGLPPLSWQLREMQEQFRSHGSPDWPVRSGPLGTV